MFRVEVDFAPAYELCISLAALMLRRLHRLLDLGPNWASKTLRQLSPALRGALQSASEIEGNLPLDLLVRYCPGERTPAGFIEWVRTLTPGSIYELAAPHLADGQSLPRDLAEVRDRWSRILELWNDEYFSRLDPVVIATLRASADRWEAMARSEDAEPATLVESATGGLVLERGRDLGTVLLIPQHHVSPVNTFETYRQLLMCYCPVEMPPRGADDPPGASVRLVRALSDPQRLRILRLLGSGPQSFTEVVRFLRQPKSTVHYHLVILRAAGLVRVHTRLALPSRPTAARRLGGATERYSLRAGALRDGYGTLLDYLLRKEGELSE